MPRVHPSRDTSLLRHSYLIIYYIKAGLPASIRLVHRLVLFYDYLNSLFTINSYSYDTSRYSDCSVVRSKNCLSDNLT